MADPSRYRDSRSQAGDADVGHDRGSLADTPRWVKVFGIIALVLVVLFVILQLVGVGGGHGPGRHASSGGAGAPPAPGLTGGDAPPEDGRG